MKDNKIVAVLCEDTMSYHQVLIHVDGCVIDDTGDGNISERAGAEYHCHQEGTVQRPTFFNKLKRCKGFLLL